MPVERDYDALRTSLLSAFSDELGRLVFAAESRDIELVAQSSKVLLSRYEMMVGRWIEWRKAWGPESVSL